MPRDRAKSTSFRESKFWLMMYIFRGLWREISWKHDHLRQSKPTVESELKNAISTGSKSENRSSYKKQWYFRTLAQAFRWRQRINSSNSFKWFKPLPQTQYSLLPDSNWPSKRPNKKEIYISTHENFGSRISLLSSSSCRKSSDQCPVTRLRSKKSFSISLESGWCSYFDL